MRTPHHFGCPGNIRQRYVCVRRPAFEIANSARHSGRVGLRSTGDFGAALAGQAHHRRAVVQANVEVQRLVRFSCRVRLPDCETDVKKEGCDGANGGAESTGGE
jgi:hypothetical protein